MLKVYDTTFKMCNKRCSKNEKQIRIYNDFMISVNIYNNAYIDNTSLFPSIFLVHNFLTSILKNSTVIYNRVHRQYYNFWECLLLQIVLDLQKVQFSVEVVVVVE